MFVPDLGFNVGSCGPADYENGLLAFSQGPYLRVVDLSDPSQLGYGGPAQTLDLFAGGDGEIRALSIDGSQIHAVDTSTPSRYFVIDAHDPTAPRLTHESTLQMGDGIVDLEVEGGELQTIYQSGNSSYYERRDVGDPSLSLSFGAKSLGTFEWRHRLSLLDDLALFRTSSSFIGSRHRDDPTSASVTSSNAGCDMWSGTELGDLFLTDCGAVGVVQPDRPDHGFSLHDLYAPPIGGSSWNLSSLDVGVGFVWLDGVGFASNALRPWLSDHRISAESTLDGGARLRGAAGVAGPDAVAIQVHRADRTVVESGVEADGSFDLLVADVAIGERLTIQALDLSRHGGRRLRVRVPIGVDAGSLELATGAARVSLSGEFLAAVPATQPISGVVEVPVIRFGAGGPVELSRVTVVGPVADVVLLNEVLYVAGQQLYVFDLSDPAAPVESPPVDLFTGNRLLGLVESDGDLRALGATATAQRLKTVSLASPLAPVEVAGTQIDLSAVASVRLQVIAGSLYRHGVGRIDRWSIPAGAMPVLAGLASLGSTNVTDLELVGGQLYAAIAGSGTRLVNQSGSSISLGPAPVRAETAVALAAIPDGGEDRLFRVAGLGGLKRDGPQELLQIASRCFLRDVTRMPNGRLLMLTDCGIDVREVLP